MSGSYRIHPRRADADRITFMTIRCAPRVPSAPFCAAGAFLVLVAGRAAVETQTAKAADAGWQPLFDGKTLANWKPTKFSGEGAVKVENGRLVLEAGKTLTGITWAGPALPTTNYEIALQAMRVEGRDFFAGVTFPVDDSFCSLILGGWGGAVVGLSSINGMDASENDTSQSIEFEIGTLVQRPHPRHARENRGLARRAADHHPGSQGQQDRDPDRGGSVAAAWCRLVSDEIGAARYSPPASLEVVVSKPARSG